MYIATIYNVSGHLPSYLCPMKSFLLIAYYWPPASGPGVQRWLKLCKYMEEYSWTPIVLTVKNGSYPASDEQLLEEVSNHWPVYTSRTIEPISLFQRLIGRSGAPTSVGMDTAGSEQSWLQRKITALGLYIRANIFVPDARMGWKRYALPKALEIIEKHQVQAIITTGPPQSVHLIALDLYKKVSIPWLADFRDPWTSAYYNANLNRSASAQRRDLALETAVLSAASAVTCVSPAMKVEFADRNENVHVVYNGYDPSDFTSSEPVEVSANFVVAYVGTIKNLEIQPSLWRAISKLRDEHPEFKRDFRLEFTGNVSAAVKESIREHSIAECTYYHGFADHKTAIARMHAAAALLFIIADLPGSDKIVTGKIFEYLASGTPILGIGPANGGADMILQDVGSQSLMPYEAQEIYQSRLMELYTRWKDKPAEETTPHTIPEKIKQYSRRAQAAEMAQILEQISH